VTRILLIEDNADAREALRALLELDGYEVHAAADGSEGLDLARTKTPEVALIDIGLPGFDGYEVARRLKTLPAPAPVMIALTGYSEPDDRQRGKDAGFAAHLVKPVDPDDLARTLTSLEIPGRGSRG
jgi:two-component system, sensor histidine kinase